MCPVGLWRRLRGVVMCDLTRYGDEYFIETAWLGTCMCRRRRSVGTSSLLEKKSRGDHL
jgi:hypothetical protein